MDGIQCILDSDALQVAGGDLDTEGELEVNLLDRWRCEHLLQYVLVIHRARRRVDLPVSG